MRRNTHYYYTPLTQLTNSEADLRLICALTAFPSFQIVRRWAEFQNPTLLEFALSENRLIVFYELSFGHKKKRHSKKFIVVI